MRRTPLPWPPSLTTQERPVPGAAELLGAALAPLRTALEGVDLAGAGVVITTHDSPLAPVASAWARKPHAESTKAT